MISLFSDFTTEVVGATRHWTERRIIRSIFTATRMMVVIEVEGGRPGKFGKSIQVEIDCKSL